MISCIAFTFTIYQAGVAFILSRKESMKITSRSIVDPMRWMLPKSAKDFVKGILSITTTIKARLQLGIGVRPISEDGGFDRGTPINRYYLEQFLQEFASDIRGRCMEFQGDEYTSRFGGRQVTKLEILHKEAGNREATIVADLTAPNQIPSDWFDCIICTYVLHSIFEVEKAVSELYRILKPGGVVLVAVPHIAKYRPKYTEAWRFTPEGLKLLLERTFGPEHVTLRTYGNSLTAAGLIRGLAAHEFSKTELDQNDPSFPVGLFARARKRMSV